ncbi:lanthionine synthetase C family protein [Streptomyces sp. NPDC001515]
MTIVPPTSDTSLAARQSLAHGPMSTVLLHIERALRGAGDWTEVHRVLAATGPLIEGGDACLFLGAPAMAFALHLAADGSNRYAGALHTLDHIVAEHTHARLAAAHDRIDARRRPTFAEYDLLRGLTGIGALLLLRKPHGAELRGILDYLVRLTEPLTDRAGQTLPGWWVGHAPAANQSTTPGGHANAGLAHGITGPLALLSLAMRAGVHTDRQEQAIQRICRWLDQIRQSDACGLRWPRWISQRGASPSRPAAPSWCYGTPGLARAQQLAAIVLDDTHRKHMAEEALVRCLADTRQLDLLTDRGLCHGVGGFLRTVQRVAADADNPSECGHRFEPLLERYLLAAVPDENGFLVGRSGAALAYQDAAAATTPKGQWDTCLLLT